MTTQYRFILIDIKYIGVKYISMYFTNELKLQLFRISK